MGLAARQGQGVAPARSHRGGIAAKKQCTFRRVTAPLTGNVSGPVARACQQCPARLGVRGVIVVSWSDTPQDTVLLAHALRSQSELLLQQRTTTDTD